MITTVQLQVINHILSTGNYSWLIVNNIDKSYFSEYPNEFEFITEHFNQYQHAPDTVTFLNKFPSFDIIEVNEPESYLLDAIAEDKSKRELAKVFNQIRNALNDDDVEKAMNIYVSSVDSAVKTKHLDCIDILKDTSRYDDFLVKCDNPTKFRIKTGFDELDQIIGGWDRQEELATIIARSNMGKSWMLIKIALAAVEQGLKVGLYSGEMSVNKVAYRFDTLAAHIPNTSLTRGDFGISPLYKKYIDELPEKYEGSLKILTPEMINGPAGVTALRAFIEKENLDMLCIDQHSLLEDDHKAKNPVEKASNISKDLKNLQVLKKIPIIAVSQQNRESTEGGINLTHIAQSDRIGQDSTVVISFEQKDSIIEMSLIKSRDSQNNKHISYVVNLNEGIFEYLPEENNAIDGQGTEQLRNEYENNNTFS